MKKIICVIQCFSVLFTCFWSILIQELLPRKIMIWMSQNYCRWSVIGEGKVLWTFVHFPCWDTVYKKLWLELIVSPVLKNSSYRADARDFFSVWGWVYIGFFLGIWLKCIIRFLSLYRFIVSCIYVDTAIQKQARIFFFPTFLFLL